MIVATYLVDRNNKMARDDLLMSYRELTPVTVETYDTGNIYYEDFWYGEDIGRVILSYHEEDLSRITIRDEKNGYVREYLGKVLYQSYDYQKEELLANIKSYLRPKFWLSGSRIISSSYSPKAVRTEEECEYLNNLLQQGDLEVIRSYKNAKLIENVSGEYFIN